MNKKKMVMISLILLIVGIVFCGITYIVFHFVGPSGFEAWSPTARKPVVSYMFATFTVLCLFASLLFFLIGLVNPKK